jgi:hypothetical protein
VQKYAFGLWRVAWSGQAVPLTVVAKDSMRREKETRMNHSIPTKSIATGLAVGALWLAAPAAGSVADPATVPPADTQAGIVLHRDATQATPFVAEVQTPATVPGDGDGFDWGDAAIGGGAALLGAALLMGGSSVLGGRRRASKPAGAISQGA